MNSGSDVSHLSSARPAEEKQSSGWGRGRLQMLHWFRLENNKVDLLYHLNLNEKHTEWCGFARTLQSPWLKDCWVNPRLPVWVSLQGRITAQAERAGKPSRSCYFITFVGILQHNRGISMNGLFLSFYLAAENEKQAKECKVASDSTV